MFCNITSTTLKKTGNSSTRKTSLLPITNVIVTIIKKIVAKIKNWLVGLPEFFFSATFPSDTHV